MNYAIELTNGGHVLLDRADFERFDRWRWTRMPNGYPARTAYRGRKVLLHREVIGAKPGEHVDHINGDKLDARKANLRIVTRSQNMHNRSKQSNNTSGAKGVSWDEHRKKWRANIQVDGSQKSLGRFDSREEAVAAYDTAATQMVGDVALTNAKGANQ